MTAITVCVTRDEMHPERYKHLAKYLADISKLIIGAGVVVRFFSVDAIKWPNLILGLLGGVILFIISLFMVPKE